MERFYIYKLTFRNKCTYIGKHHQKKSNDDYITSSSYYKKHKDLLEKREIILDVNDIETLDIMETICILGDIAENDLNVNYNYGAWLNNSKFDRGFCGAANGMYGKKHSEMSRIKMKAKWTKERKEAARRTRQEYNRTDDFKKNMKALNQSQEHKDKCNKTRHNNLVEHARYVCRTDPSVITDFNTYTYVLKRDKSFIRTIDDAPLSGDIDKWVRDHKVGKGNASKGKHWFNNGIIETYAFECPDGFVKGRLKFSKEHINNLKTSMQRIVLRGGNKPMLGKEPWNKGLKGVKRKCQMDK